MSQTPSYHRRHALGLMGAGGLATGLSIMTPGLTEAQERAAAYLSKALVRALWWRTAL